MNDEVGVRMICPDNLPPPEITDYGLGPKARMSIYQEMFYYPETFTRPAATLLRSKTQCGSFLHKTQNRETVLSDFSFQINKLQHQKETEVTLQSQLKQQVENLRDQLDQCVKRNEQLEREALDLRCQMIALQDEQSYTKQYCSDKHRAHQQQPEHLWLFPQVESTKQQPLAGGPSSEVASP